MKLLHNVKNHSPRSPVQPSLFDSMQVGTAAEKNTVQEESREKVLPFTSIATQLMQTQELQMQGFPIIATANENRGLTWVRLKATLKVSMRRASG